MIWSQKINMTTNYLLTKDSQTVQHWLKQIWSEELTVADDFNWLGVAQMASQKATGFEASDDQEARLRWVEIALNVYAYLAKQAERNARESYQLSAMRLRAAMIIQFEPVTDHPILDIKAITTWFFEQTPIERQEVIQLLRNWRSLPIQEILKLRQIKNRLSVIELLMEEGHLQEDHELRHWLAIKGCLP